MRRILFALLFPFLLCAQSQIGGNSSGGITSVSSLPATCTPGVTAPVQLSVVPYGVYSCARTANTWIPAGGGPFTIDPRAYGAAEDTKYYFGNLQTITVNSGNPVITITGTGALPLATDVGKRINITNGCCNQAVSAPTTGLPILPATTTISAVNTGNGQITLNKNPTNTCTTACAVAIFTDDTVAAQSATAALAALPVCGTVHLVGFLSTSKGIFNTNNVTCEKSSAFTDVAGGNAMTGESEVGSGVFIETEFDATTCTGNNGNVSNICFLADIAGGANFTFFGLFNSVSGGTDNVHIVAPFTFDSVSAQAFTNVAFMDFMGGDPGTGIGTNIGFQFLAGTLTGVNVVGFGAVACQYGGQGGPLYTQIFSGSCGNSIYWNLSIIGTLNTFGLTMGQTGGTQPTVNENNAAAVWYSENDAIYGNPGSFANSLISVSTGKAFISGLLAQQTIANSNGIAVGAAGIVHLHKVNLAGVSTGFGLNLSASGAQAFDDGDNVINSVNVAAGAKYITSPTTSNCSSSASPAVCGFSSSGSVAIAAAATTLTVNTVAVTANSQILITEDSSLGTKLGVTCNTTTGRTYTVTTRTAATSFVVTASAAPAANPACLSYTVVN